MQEPMQDQQRWDQLEAAVRDAVETSQGNIAGRRRATKVTTPPGRTLILLSLLLWTFIAWIWSTRPAFLFGEPVRATVSAEVDEASLRFALYLERGRVDAYMRRAGQLPATLSATGTVEAGVSMVRTSDGYQLVGRRGASELQLSSRMNADSFLGNSLQVLRRSTGNQQ